MDGGSPIRRIHRHGHDLTRTTRQPRPTYSSRAGSTTGQANTADPSRVNSPAGGSTPCRGPCERDARAGDRAPGAGHRLRRRVIVPSATFIATASAVAACGARPVVVDVDRALEVFTPQTVAPAITSKTAAVIVVHVGGYPADVDGLVDLAAAYRLHLIEDCAEAHGAHRNGRAVGTWGRIAAWSFCQDKIMTTAGEGGAVTTWDAELAKLCWELKDHGKSYHAVHQRHPSPGFRWLHDRFGTNARMTEIQAAIGRLQLPRISNWAAQRRAHAETLRSAFNELRGLRLPENRARCWARRRSILRSCKPPERRLAPDWNRDRVVEAINAEGVSCAAGGCTEIYRERAFEARPWQASRAIARCPVAWPPLLRPPGVLPDLPWTLPTLRLLCAKSLLRHPDETIH